MSFRVRSFLICHEVILSRRTNFSDSFRSRAFQTHIFVIDCPNVTQAIRYDLHSIGQSPLVLLPSAGPFCCAFRLHLHAQTLRSVPLGSQFTPPVPITLSESRSGTELSALTCYRRRSVRTSFGGTTPCHDAMFSTCICIHKYL